MHVKWKKNKHKNITKLCGRLDEIEQKSMQVKFEMWLWLKEQK